MNVFEAVKHSVTTRQAASFYGIRVGRNGMVCCPFHNDRTPSMKVDSRFYCFGCGASGDVIDFAALLHGLGKREAAVRLAEDFGVSDEKSGNAPPDRKRHNRSQPRQKSAEQRFQETERYCFRVLCDYQRLLEHWKTAYAPQPQDAIWHPLFVEALQRISSVSYTHLVRKFFRAGCSCFYSLFSLQCFFLEVSKGSLYFFQTVSWKAVGILCPVDFVAPVLALIFIK